MDIHYGDNIYIEIRKWDWYSAVNLGWQLSYLEIGVKWESCNSPYLSFR